MRDRVGFPNGIGIDAATRDQHVAPRNRLAFTSGTLFGIQVALRTGRNDCYRDLIGTVATVDGRVIVVERTVGRNGLTVPEQYCSLRQIFRLGVVVRGRLIQVDTLDTVAARRQRNRIINNGRTCVFLALPCGLVAEYDRTNRALYRRYRQVQREDTVFACAGLVANHVRVRACYLAQLGQTLPFERIALTDRQRLLEVITRLVFGQNQAVDIVTSGRLVRVLELIRAGYGIGLRARCAVVDIVPRKAVVVGNSTASLIHNRLILNDMYVDQRVATQIRAIVTCFVIRVAVEADTTACADSKRGVLLLYLTNGQIQTVEYIYTARLMNHFRVVVGLVSLDAVPYKR